MIRIYSSSLSSAEWIEKMPSTGSSFVPLDNFGSVQFSALLTLDEILRFKEWVINNNCEAVAIESTGIYWISIYTVLEGNVEVIYIPDRTSLMLNLITYNPLC
jgi:hypothetical protein